MIKMTKMTSHCAGTEQATKSQKLGQEREKKWDQRRERQVDRDGAEVTGDGRLFHRRADATGNALQPTVDSRVCRTTRDMLRNMLSMQVLQVAE